MVDGEGNIYLADKLNHRIRRIDAVTGNITTVAGSGQEGFSGDGGPAVDASMARPTGVAIDQAGNLYIADSHNSRIRRVAAGNGIITTVAGTGELGFTGDEGPATDAQINTPLSLAVDAAGNLYIADTENHRIRRVDTSGVILTVAGTGRFGFSGDGNVATSASLFRPVAVAADHDGNLYIADLLHHRIRRVDGKTGIITTTAGVGGEGFSGDGGIAADAHLSEPRGIAVDKAGNLYIADALNHRIRRVEGATGIISTIAGTGEEGFSGDGGDATQSQLSHPSGTFVDFDGHLSIADAGNHLIRKVEAGTGVITTLAGIGKSGFSGDGGPAIRARLNEPQGIVADQQGNLYIADTWNQRVRRVDAATGVITTVAGTGEFGFSGDEGPAVEARLGRPAKVALNWRGDLYIADPTNHRVRRVDATSQIITTVAGTGEGGYSGDQGPANLAQLAQPWGVFVDRGGHLYIADSRNGRVRKVEVTAVTAVADVAMPERTPTEFFLEQNHPNPFNPRTRIRYHIVREGTVYVTVYDLLGQRIRVLVSQWHGPGVYQAVWDGNDSTGRSVASGVYVYRLASRHEVLTRRMLHLK